MKLTVEKAVASAIAVKELGERKIKFQTALKVAKNRRVLDEVGQMFEQRRADLAREFGTAGDNGMISIPKEKIDEFSKREMELRSEELELELEIVTLHDLQSNPDEIIEPNILVPLDWMIVDVVPRPKNRPKR